MFEFESVPFETLYFFSEKTPYDERKLRFRESVQRFKSAAILELYKPPRKSRTTCSALKHESISFEKYTIKKQEPMM